MGVRKNNRKLHTDGVFEQAAAPNLPKTTRVQVSDVFPVELHPCIPRKTGISTVFPHCEDSVHNVETQLYTEWKTAQGV